MDLYQCCQHNWIDDLLLWCWFTRWIFNINCILLCVDGCNCLIYWDKKKCSWRIYGMSIKKSIIRCTIQYISKTRRLKWFGDKNETTKNRIKISDIFYSMKKNFCCSIVFNYFFIFVFQFLTFYQHIKEVKVFWAFFFIFNKQKWNFLVKIPLSIYTSFPFSLYTHKGTLEFSSSFIFCKRSFNHKLTWFDKTSNIKIRRNI